MDTAKSKMIFMRTSTVKVWGEYRADGLNIYDEIDDDEWGLKSEVRYVIPPDSVTKLFKLISEDDFFTLCKQDGLDEMCRYLDAHDIPYRRETIY